MFSSISESLFDNSLSVRARYTIILLSPDPLPFREEVQVVRGHHRVTNRQLRHWRHVRLQQLGLFQRQVRGHLQFIQKASIFIKKDQIEQLIEISQFFKSFFKDFRSKKLMILRNQNKIFKIEKILRALGKLNLFY
jgi:hypothetical protein